MARFLATFAALRHRNYRLLWIGTLISQTGDWMDQIALNWLLIIVATCRGIVISFNLPARHTLVGAVEEAAVQVPCEFQLLLADRQFLRRRQPSLWRSFVQMGRSILSRTPRR